MGQRTNGSVEVVWHCYVTFLQLPHQSSKVHVNVNKEDTFQSIT